MKSIFQKTYLLSLALLITLSASLSAQNLFFERVYDETLAQASYVIANTQTKEAIVIDAQRDIDIYLDMAKKHDFTITKVTETHIHADFLCGSRELVAATGAALYLSEEGGEDWQYEFPHLPLKDGSQLQLGNIQLDVMHTPGHTPESITFILTDGTSQPAKAITGDFIFVGDLGRPDLLEKAAGHVGSQEVGAKQLYASLMRFVELPDNTEIWPAHGAGSFCGKSLSTVPNSTLKDEKISSKAFSFLNDEEGFVKYILADQPSPPMYFAKMKYLNKVSRPLLVEVPKHSELSKSSADRAIANNLIVIDTRHKSEVAKGHIPGSLHIENGSKFSTYMGSLMDYEQQFILVAEEDAIEDLTRKLMRIGMDNIYGYISSVENQSLALETSAVVDMSTFENYLASDNVQIIDVRTEGEFSDGHIKGVDNIVLASLDRSLDKISKDKPVIVYCKSGARASLAYSYLRQQGFDNIMNYVGGINEWLEHNKELVQSDIQ